MYVRMAEFSQQLLIAVYRGSLPFVTRPQDTDVISHGKARIE